MGWTISGLADKSDRYVFSRSDPQCHIMKDSLQVLGLMINPRTTLTYLYISVIGCLLQWWDGWAKNDASVLFHFILTWKLQKGRNIMLSCRVKTHYQPPTGLSEKSEAMLLDVCGNRLHAHIPTCEWISWYNIDISKHGGRFRGSVYTRGLQ